MDNGFTSISRMFSAFTSLFSAVFGFLPDWVLVFIGSAFVFMIMVFIYKLIRG